jgi:hypothetical protein
MDLSNIERATCCVLAAIRDIEHRALSASTVIGMERFAKEYSKTPERATAVPKMLVIDAAVLNTKIEAAMTTYTHCRSVSRSGGITAATRPGWLKHVANAGQTNGIIACALRGGLRLLIIQSCQLTRNASAGFDSYA